MSQPEYKVGGALAEFKVAHVNGVEVGLISGHIATWDLDLGLDRFHKGAFKKSLHRHRRRPKLDDGSSPGVTMKHAHGPDVGIWPIEGLREDSTGLFGKDGQVNLELQEGREMFSKIRARHMNSLSIGWVPIEATFEDDGFTRNITEADFVEGSPVVSPMNEAAMITGFKDRFRDLTVSAKDVGWNGYEGADRRAFLAGDEMPIAQLVGDELVVCQSQLLKHADALIEQGPDACRAHVATLERYLAKSRIPSPFPDEMRGFFDANDLEKITPRQMEAALKAGGHFSNSLVKALVGRVKGQLHDGSDPDPASAQLQSILAALKGSQKDLQSAMQ